jgi:hypothetical protein
MSANQKEEMKAKLMKGGMTEYHAAMAAGILAPEDEPGPSAVARHYADQQKSASEAARRFMGQHAA